MVIVGLLLILWFCGCDFDGVDFDDGVDGIDDFTAGFGGGFGAVASLPDDLREVPTGFEGEVVESAPLTLLLLLLFVVLLLLLLGLAGLTGGRGLEGGARAGAGE